MNEKPDPLDVALGVSNPEGEPEKALCPCCGEPELQDGLFSEFFKWELPLPVMASNQAANRFSDHFLIWNERYFFRAFMPLPVRRPDSPVGVFTWVEIDKATAFSLIPAIDGSEPLKNAHGRLANDLQGLNGLAGAEVTFDSDPSGNGLITFCADSRIRDLDDEDLNHQDMASLYRLVWGNPNPLIRENMEMRAAVKSRYHEIIDRPFYRRSVTPPHTLAGLVPAEVVIAPPLDTGGDAIVATVGCAEAMIGAKDPTGRAVPPVEIMARVKDPSPEFLDSFGQFGYYSRFNSEMPITDSALLVAPAGIPGADAGFRGWFARIPEGMDAEDSTITAPSSDVVLIEVFPLHSDEIAEMLSGSADQVLDRLSVVDLSDLHRESVSQLAS